jgi:hypothetical protein
VAAEWRSTHNYNSCGAQGSVHVDRTLVFQESFIFIYSEEAASVISYIKLIDLPI